MMKILQHHMTDTFKDGIAFARTLDSKNQLAKFADRFYKTDEIYMDGNSLGLANKDAEEALLEALAAWKKEAIKIWNVADGKFFNISRLIAQRTAPLINAGPGEIITMGTITSNILQGINTFYQPTKDRYKIIVDELNFPGDIYAVKSMIASKGLKVEDALKVIHSRDGRTLDEDDIVAAMTDDVAVAWLPSVLYRSAQLLDMAHISKAGRKRGVFVGWSMAHSIGSVPHDFRKIEPDFAVWCTYKYLNAGPGSNAGMFINRRHFGRKHGFHGWFGNRDATQFAMRHHYDPDVDANNWLLGTHTIFSLYPVYGALKIFEDAGIQTIRDVSLQMTSYLMYLIDTKLSQYGFRVGNPREDHRRGGHVACEHDEAYRISAALRDLKVIPDFREPNVIRLAPVALYNTYEEIYEVVTIMEKIAKEKIYETLSNERATVV
jgi:kynureninase